MCGKPQLTVGGASPMHMGLSCMENIAEQARGSETEQHSPRPLLHGPFTTCKQNKPFLLPGLFMSTFIIATKIKEGWELVSECGLCWDGHVGRTLELWARPLGAYSLMSFLKQVSRQHSSGVSASVPVSGVLP